jgi:hypothetical protein
MAGTIDAPTNATTNPNVFNIIGLKLPWILRPLAIWTIQAHRMGQKKD